MWEGFWRLPMDGVPLLISSPQRPGDRPSVYQGYLTPYGRRESVLDVHRNVATRGLQVVKGVWDVFSAGHKRQ
jgi:hypothetical protein